MEVYDNAFGTLLDDTDGDDGTSIPVTASVKVYVDLNLPGKLHK